MNGYPGWLINSMLTIQSSLESTTSVSNEDTSDDGQGIEIETTTKKSTSKKSQVVQLPYIKVLSEQIRRVFKQCDILAYFKPMNTQCHLLVRPKD